MAWAAAAGIGSYGLYYLVTTRDGAARASTLLYLTPRPPRCGRSRCSESRCGPRAVLGLLISATAVVLLRNAAARRGVARGPDALAAAPAGADAVIDR